MFADSWSELHKLLRADAFAGALIDPQAGGDHTASALQIVRQNPGAHVFAYVAPTPESLLSILTLSKHGLEDVFVHPVRLGDKRFVNAMEKVSGDRMASDVLGAVDGKLRVLDFGVMAAVLDLFHRPYRYQTAADLASQAGISVRCLYRALREAEFGTPRKLITMAKAIHGYCYVFAAGAQVREVRDKLGYGSSKAFSAHILEHLGIRASRLRRRMDREELVLRLIEDLNKPRDLRRELRVRRLSGRDR